MGVSIVENSLALGTPSLPILPQDFLNCYEIVNAATLSWPVTTYVVERQDGSTQRHDRRGEIKGIIWKLLRGRYRHVRKGRGFVIDMSPRLVALPSTWPLPAPIAADGYAIRPERSFVARPDEHDRPIIEGIIREGIKNHFKNDYSQELGELWQHYNGFCQSPNRTGDESLMCRRFGFAAKVLRGGMWVVQFTVSTVTVDGRFFEDYYRAGEVARLAEMIRLKRRERVDRDNRPVEVRVLHCPEASSKVTAFDLEDVDLVLQHGILPRTEQGKLVVTQLRCNSFPSTVKSLPLSEIRLILDSQITEEDHAETILEPSERQELTHRVRSFVNGVDLYGQPLELSGVPMDANSLGGIFIPPPAVRVSGAHGRPVVLRSPTPATERTLVARGRQRAEQIRKYGFLVQRPINPALAWPEGLGESRGRRMKRDLEYVWEVQGIGAKFEFVPYRRAEDIRRALDRTGNDCALVVLPEASSNAGLPDDTHESVKRTIEVPSQCIYHDHTLPISWVSKAWRDFKVAKPELARKVQQRYQLALSNLLVKHHWFPFVPASSFRHNVQVGLDVGGVHNTSAMACLGYGFCRPLDLLLFRPEEIPIEVQKKEPIPTECLYRGLLALFECVHDELVSCGVQPDFDTALFYRDGQFSGDGDNWNELDALKRLHEELLGRKWISQDSVWTGVEVMKGAEGWRLMRGEGVVVNPLVGKCVFAFEDDGTALVSTTGVPYLLQGTARPLKIRIAEIHGRREREHVLRDLVWQCDMCFTKPDMGMSLPWVLYVADSGALQLSRSYKITGITA